MVDIIAAFMVSGIIALLFVVLWVVIYTAVSQAIKDNWPEE